jgi:tetratricopeptide (TPR) repeat protein
MMTLIRLSYLYLNERKYSQGEEIVRRGIAMGERLAPDHPESAVVAMRLGNLLQNRGVFEMFAGNQQAALDTECRALGIYHSVLRKDSHNRWARESCNECLGQVAEILMRQGRHAEALSRLEELVALSDPLNHEAYLLLQALTRARLGDRSVLLRLGNQARRILRERAGPQPLLYSLIYYDAACIQAALAQIALQDPGKPLTDRQSAAQPDFERAIELLYQARAAGEFKGTMISLDELRREKLLDPLRNRLRFQILMMDLAFPADPFAP